MSYTIYKNIRQNADGTFDCVCASSNLFNARTGGLVFENYHMNYFNQTFPTATNKEKKACWLLYSTWNGDKFYPKAWKDGQALASQFMKEFEIDYEDFYKDSVKWLNYAKKFIEYQKTLKQTVKKSKFIVRFWNGQYVYKKTAKRCSTVMDSVNAKVFYSDLKSLENQFKGYSHCSPKFIEVM